MDPFWLAVIVLGAISAAVVAVTYVHLPDQRQLGRRGVIYARRVAFVLGIALIVLTTMLFLGLAALSDADNRLDAIPLVLIAGPIVGAALGLAYFWVNVVVLSIGLWFRPPQRWALVATLLTPLAVVALGFGDKWINSLKGL